MADTGKVSPYSDSLIIGLIASGRRAVWPKQIPEGSVNAAHISSSPMAQPAAQIVYSGESMHLDATQRC